MEKIIPHNRKKADLDALLDKISALKSAILIKLRLEQEMKIQKRLIRLMAFKPLFTFLTILVAPFWTMVYWSERRIERLKMERNLEVKVKQRNAFHKSELLYEDALSTIKAEMKDRFDHYFSRLQFFFNNYDKDSDIPYNDVKLLLKKFREDPPKDNNDKLQFYLSMESTIALCVSKGGGI